MSSRLINLFGTIGHSRYTGDDLPDSERRDMIRKAEADPVKHHTVGVYKNQSYKENCVPSAELEQHVKYNTENRWGRGLFVDGKCVHQGYLSDEEVVAWEAKLKDWPMPKINYPRH
jgi:hypothetical protein